jgi:hypothetical protein
MNERKWSLQDTEWRIINSDDIREEQITEIDVTLKKCVKRKG